MEEIFQLGQEASKSKFVGALDALQTQGTGVLATLEKARLDSLVEFDRRLQAINGRRTRSWRVASREQAVKFVASDFTDIDQANTTGTVRADSASVSLKERAVPAEAVIKTNRFSSDRGTIEALDAAQSILRVHTDDFSTPTGQFDIELVTPLTLNQFIIDIVSTPSQPIINVTVSGDGLTYTSASKVAINGYRINVWLPATEVRFIRIQIIPSHPDDLNGNTWTFGITNFSAQATDYHLRSEVLTKTIQFSPKSEFVVLDAPIDPKIQYYLSIYDATTVQAPFVEINAGDAVHIGTSFTTTVTTSVYFPYQLASAPADLYLSTVKVTENGVKLHVATGLLPTDPDIASLAHEYVAVVPSSLGYDIRLLDSSADTGLYSQPRSFVVSYVYGPSLVNVQLKVRLSTDDRATSPVFHGASLDEV